MSFSGGASLIPVYFIRKVTSKNLKERGLTMKLFRFLFAVTALLAVFAFGANEYDVTDGNPASAIFEEITAVLTDKAILLIGLLIAAYGGWNFYKTKQKEELIYAAIGGTIVMTATELTDSLEAFGGALFSDTTPTTP
jgi:hypothetical protein